MQKQFTLIKATNIHKSYGDLHVLKGIDLSVNKGEIISIVGKSGAGKSTLLHILGTLDLPDNGSLSLNGTEVSNLSQKELARFRNKNIGFIFQFHHLLNEFTAEENVAIPAFIAGEPKQKSLNRAKELLDYLGLAERISHKPTELSGGEQQRVAVARALMNEPNVVFADEPTGNLDKATSNDLHNLLLRLRDEMNQTFVIVTHNEELANLSDRTITMEDGLIR
ncbi:MAG: ABC transporter ATP-binding protein [Saprospiraceae bacterium]|nr:ABC transporter ATP-binding protein [Saprospiraceae bacterium]